MFIQQLAIYSTGWALTFTHPFIHSIQHTPQEGRARSNRIIIDFPSKMDDTTEWVYHEKQDSSLCGQHALNVLFQGPFFTAPDLAGKMMLGDDDDR